MSRPRGESRALRGLLRTFWALDLRAQHYAKATGAKAGEVLPPLFWVVGQFLTVSLLLTLVLVGRVDLFVFAGAHLSLAAVLTFSALIVELDEAVFHPQDHAVIAHRPVTLRTYALARFGNLLRYVGLLSLAVLVFPLIVGATLPEAGPSFVPTFLLAFATVQLVTTAAVVAMHAVVRRSGGDGLRAALAWVQILAILALFYGGQLMVKQGSTALTELAAARPEWTALVPTGWLALRVERGAWLELLGTLGLATLFAWIAGLRLARAYARIRQHGALAAGRTLPAVGPTLAGRARLALSGHRATRAGYWLTRTLLRRDHDVQARLWPHLALPGAVGAMAFAVGRTGDPWRGAEGLEFTLALPPVLAAVVPLLVLGLRYGRDPRASMRLAPARAQDAASFDTGVRRALWLSVLAPVVGATTLAYAIAWRAPHHALAHGAFLVLCLAPCVAIAQRALLAEVPFGRAPRRGTIDGSALMLSAGMGAAVGALSVGYFAIAGDPEKLGLALGGTAALGWALTWWSARR